MKTKYGEISITKESRKAPRFSHGDIRLFYSLLFFVKCTSNTSYIDTYIV